MNVAASMIFAGMSGAALADLAGLGAVEMRAMRKNGYPIDISAAVTLASCTIGPIIPPSIVLIVYGLATDTSVGRLFLGGIVPGFAVRPRDDGLPDPVGAVPPTPTGGSRSRSGRPRCGARCAAARSPWHRR